jgi:riboflavin synthase
VFTGIIEEVGTIAAAGSRMKVQCRTVLEDSKAGASIAVNGVCLTAVSIEPDGFWCDLSPETLSRSNLGMLQDGSRVHLVQGHVDGTAEFVSLESLPDGNWWLKARMPAELDRYLIHKGSVTLDGVSLTIAALDQNIVSVAIIPHTYENTVLPDYEAGSKINVEVDLIGKYVEKLLHGRARC